MTATFPDLDGASVFITGGGSGIGAALTDGFLAQGARVAFIDRLDSRAFAKAMGQKHGRAPLFLQGDVTDTPTLHAAMDDAAQAHGPLDVLVNNAADDLRLTAAAISVDGWDAQMAVNLRAYFFACQKAHAMMKGRGGAIVNYTSTSYMIGMGGMVPYTTANAGITSLTRTLSQEWGRDGVRLNALAPGWVLTDKQKEKWATPEGLAAFMERQSIKRFMSPQDVVAPTLFLASNASAMMTGQVLIVDAGVVGPG